MSEPIDARWLQSFGFFVSVAAEGTCASLNLTPGNLAGGRAVIIEAGKLMPIDEGPDPWLFRIAVWRDVVSNGLEELFDRERVIVEHTARVRAEVVQLLYAWGAPGLYQVHGNARGLVNMGTLRKHPFR